MSNPRRFNPLTTAIAAVTVACAGGGGLNIAGLPGMAHGDSPHPIPRGVTQ